jgi:iron complex outermembrane receptor protein
VGTQKNYAFFAEVVAPVLKSLELSAAARYDHYDTYGGQVVPKVGAKWTPMQEVALRGTWGKGFRAPSIAESGDAKLVYGALPYRDPENCPASLPSGNPDLASPRNVITPNQCSLNPPFLQNTNPDLKAEKSNNWTVGFLVEPIKGWSTSVDYYQIKLDNQILPRSAFPDFDFDSAIVRGPINSVTFGDGRQGPSPVGILAYLGDIYVNATSTKTSGIDLMSNYAMTLPDTSRLKFVAQWSHIFAYDVTYKGETYKLAGTHGPAIISGNTGNPKDRLQLTGQWAKGPFTGTLMGNYVGGYSNTDPLSQYDCLGMTQYANASRFNGNQVPPDKYCKISSFWFWNLNLQYQYDKQTMVQFSVINLFNNQAPVDLGSYAGAGDNRNSGRGSPYNPSLHFAGIQGTSFQLGLTYNF